MPTPALGSLWLPLAGDGATPLGGEAEPPASFADGALATEGALGSAAEAPALGVAVAAAVVSGRGGATERAGGEVLLAATPGVGAALVAFNAVGFAATLGW
jgi:hypothetical protein